MTWQGVKGKPVEAAYGCEIVKAADTPFAAPGGDMVVLDMPLRRPAHYEALLKELGNDSDNVARQMDLRRHLAMAHLQDHAWRAPWGQPGQTWQTMLAGLQARAKAGDKTWSGWREQAVRDDFMAVLSPPGRFLQYRLKLVGAGGQSPAVKQVEIVYQVGNLPPVVSGLTAAATEKVSLKGRTVVAPSKVYRSVKITAADPNGDKLTFTLAFREQRTDKWITITDKLAAPAYVWDTRTIGDGVYELRVTASDKASNTPGSALEAARISQRIVVDNTPPVIRPLAAKAAGKAVSISGQVIDASSRIASIEYAVDSQSQWRPVLPKDGIADSKREQLAFEVKDLAAGEHRIAIRAKDLYGNTGYASASVTIGK